MGYIQYHPNFSHLFPAPSMQHCRHRDSPCTRMMMTVLALTVLSLVVVVPAVDSNALQPRPILVWPGVGDSRQPTSSTATLSSARRDLGGAAAGGLAFFAGGCTDTASPYQCTSPTAAVDVVTSTGSVTAGPPLSVARGWAAGCGTGEVAVFAGGGTGGADPHSSVADVLDTSTTTVTATAYPRALVIGRWGLGCTVVAGKVFYAGGKAIPSPGTYAMTSAVDTFDPATKSWLAAAYNLTHKKECVAGAASGDSVVWAGGWLEFPDAGRGGPISEKADIAIDIVDSDGVHGSPDSLAVGAEWAGAATGPDGKAYVLGQTEFLTVAAAGVLNRSSTPIGAGVVAASVTNNGGAVGDRHVCFYSLTPSAVVCYDVVAKQWRPSLPCTAAHQGGAFVVANSTIFVAGGFDADNGNTPTAVIDIITIPSSV